jgi:transcriptional regulator with XRE-family HTH domain
MKKRDLPWRLRNMRESAELSGRQLDKLAGLSLGLCSRLESGKPTPDPRLSTLQAIATALGSSVEYLGTGLAAPPSYADIQRAVAAARGRAK